jgi:hypothetical protein
LPVALMVMSDRYVFWAVDPILPIPQLQVENDYSPINSETDESSNILYVKPLWKVPPNRVVPCYQGIRFSI